MILEQHTKIVGEEVKVSVKYIREHWHEWLWIDIDIGQGYAIPHFYLPTHKRAYSHSMVCWIIPLAPFVLLAIALYRALWEFWKDCVWMVKEWKDIKRPE